LKLLWFNFLASMAVLVKIVKGKHSRLQAYNMIII
jgi:hypothetical protein